MLEAKRLLDIAASGLALALLSPVMGLIALAVWIESGSPLLFSQERIGLGFRPFTLWKFRSMRAGSGPLITAAGDSRVTRIGGFLRRTKLDELPQFWNVLRGDMSLVGPRPEVRRYVDLYRRQYELILSVRPGITDPATIAYRDEELVLAASADPEAAYTDQVLPAKLALSERYISQWSFTGDIQILARTLLAVFGYGGARGWSASQKADSQADFNL
jgi:lipopolysaccharide/colanic/teichoic acid biosynthesis glycosyltransferase